MDFGFRGLHETPAKVESILGMPFFSILRRSPYDQPASCSAFTNRRDTRHAAACRIGFRLRTSQTFSPRPFVQPSQTFCYRCGVRAFENKMLAERASAKFTVGRKESTLRVKPG